MKRQLVCLLVLLATAAAVESARYVPGRLINAQVAAAPEVGTMAGNCYTLLVQVSDVLYVVHECPTFFWQGFAPHEFLEGGPVQVRMEKNKLAILRPNGKELKARIIRRILHQPFEAMPAPGRLDTATWF